MKNSFEFIGQMVSGVFVIVLMVAIALRLDGTSGGGLLDFVNHFAWLLGISLTSLVVCFGFFYICWALMTNFGRKEH